MAKKRTRTQDGNEGHTAKKAAPTPALRDADNTIDRKTDANAPQEKVLVLCSRGITYRYRHLMLDMLQLLPHCKRDAKLDTKGNRVLINEIADMKGCTSALFFEARKKKDLYLWIAKTPQGPTYKFHVANVHTMEELKLSGNHLKGSRPALSFDKSFDAEPHWQLLKEVLTHVFATPQDHPKSKPFFDHVLTFSIADGRVWMRNYQVLLPLDGKKSIQEGLSTVEVGPRCCLNPIVVLEGGFGGRVLYENPTYVSPNALRAAMKSKHGSKYVTKVTGKEKRKMHKAANVVPKNPLADVFRG